MFRIFKRTECMQLNEFYSKYANTPIANRSVFLGLPDHKFETLHDMYQNLQMLDEQLAPILKWQRELLNRAEQAFESLDAAIKKTNG